MLVQPVLVQVHVYAKFLSYGCAVLIMFSGASLSEHQIDELQNFAIIRVIMWVVGTAIGNSDCTHSVICAGFSVNSLVIVLVVSSSCFCVYLYVVHSPWLHGASFSDPESLKLLQLGFRFSVGKFFTYCFDWGKS